MLLTYCKYFFYQNQAFLMLLTYCKYFFYQNGKKNGHIASYVANNGICTEIWIQFGYELTSIYTIVLLIAFRFSYTRLCCCCVKKKPDDLEAMSPRLTETG